MGESGQNTTFDLDQVELHSDISIDGQRSRPPVRRKQNDVPMSMVVLLLIVAIGGIGAGVFFFTKAEKLSAELAQSGQAESRVTEELSTTQEALSQSEQKLAQMQGRLDKMGKRHESASAREKELETQLGQVRKELGAQKKLVTKGQQNLKAAQEQVSKISGERDQLRQAEEQGKTALAQMETEHANQLGALSAQYSEQLERQRRQEARLQDKLNKAMAEGDRFRSQASQESQASLRLIEEQNRLESTSERLKLELDRTKQELAQARKNINRLETVQPGQLVPLSEQVQPGKVRLRQPLAEGLKVPRRLGQVAVQVLVNQEGAVDQAFIVPGQDMPADLAAGVVKSVYKWRFSPPTHGPKRVKLWQTVLVGNE